MKTVWRVESEHGVGMYVARGAVGTPKVCAADTLCDRQLHPGPWQDTVLGYNELEDSTKYSFGFATLAQFKCWCYDPKVRTRLREEGFRLVKYRVVDQYYRRSNFQAIFRKNYAEQVDSREVDYV